MSMTGKSIVPVPATHHFGSSLSASLACRFLTTFIENLHLLAIPPYPSPYPPNAGRTTFPHGSNSSLATVGYIVSGRLDGSLPHRRPLRVLLMEQQVHNACALNNYSRRFARRTSTGNSVISSPSCLRSISCKTRGSAPAVPSARLLMRSYLR